MKYKLRIAEDKELGYNGIVIENFREYFDPATGIQIAHDILEHPVKPHPCGYTDELMATGGVIYLRALNGYVANPYRGASIGVDDIVSDIYRLASYYEGNIFVETHSGSSYLTNDCAMEMINEALYKTPGFFYREQDESIIWYRDNVKSWIVKGYQLAAKRYQGLNSYMLAHVLFKGIQETCDRWLKTAEEYETADLHLNLSSYECSLIDTTFNDEY